MRSFYALLLLLIPSIAQAQYWWENPNYSGANSSPTYCDSSLVEIRAWRLNASSQVTISKEYRFQCVTGQWRSRWYNSGDPYAPCDYSEVVAAASFFNFALCNSIMNCPSFPGGECSQVESPLVGFNCCGSGSFGATYYIHTDPLGCETLACQSENCHPCENPPATAEGTPCNCPSGVGQGVTVWTYGPNGCPTGTACDECVICPPKSGPPGQPCTCSDGRSGSLVDDTGPDGCPISRCECGPPCEPIGDPGGPCQVRIEGGEVASGTFEVRTDVNDCDYLACVPGSCNVDENEDGVADRLEENPLHGFSINAPCDCPGLPGDEGLAAGVVGFYDDENGCPTPFCNNCPASSCADFGGDTDGDGCCDNEDPDPNDPTVGCQDCQFQILEKVQSIVSLFRNKIKLDVETDDVEHPDYVFNLTTSGINPMGQTSSFGIVFGGDFDSFAFWLHTPPEGVRPGQGEVFAELNTLRTTFRNTLQAVFLFSFAFITFKAVFDPSR